MDKMPGSRELLFIRINEAILEQLIGKPYPEQLKVLLKIVRGVKESEQATEEVIRTAEKEERAISRELTIVNAGLN